MFSTSDEEWLRGSRYSLALADGIVSGRLHFDMVYSYTDNSYTLNPSPALILQENVIHHADDYQIRIAWDAGVSWPLCYESGGKIAAFATTRHLLLSDLHINDDGDFCLAPLQDLHLAFEEKFSLQPYIERYVIPFLFQQTHFRKNGEWAWPPAEHGAAGMYTWYADHVSDPKACGTTINYLARQLKTEPAAIVSMIRRRPYKGHMTCLCGSGKRIRKCCPAVLRAYNALRVNLIQKGPPRG